MSVTSILQQEVESFRDHLSIMDEKGKRKWVYPKFQSGKIWLRRNFIAYTLLTTLIAGPFLKINNHPVFMFNIIERTFVVWGIPFFPQDFFLFGFAMLTFLVFIILFTSVWGRWWCGWACPQTIFMEFIFRRIEFWIEGDTQKRKLLDRQELNFEKIWKKSLKHLTFFVISFFISNIFLAYIIGSDQLWKIICEPLGQHLGGLTAIIIFSGVFYGVFAFLREQVCIGVCPYGRLQGVLLDKDSMVVNYDFKRGEPRGKAGIAEGDCVDCHLCVAVCPTGIDIRNGTQMECINCAACVDACNSIMDKMHRPQGLIRIASQNQILNQQKFGITSRMMGYAALWLVMISVLSYMVLIRPEVSTTILRAPGQLYQKRSENVITNLYTVNLVNNSFDDKDVELRIVSPQQASLNLVGNPLAVKEAQTSDGAFFIALPASELHAMKTEVKIDVISGGKKVSELETAFIGPVFKHHDEERKHEEKDEAGSDHEQH